MLSSNMAASIAMEINIHLCKCLFTLLCVTVSPWTSPFVVQAHDDYIHAWCAWLPWISRSVCVIWRPSWRTAWRQWKHYWNFSSMICIISSRWSSLEWVTGWATCRSTCRSRARWCWRSRTASRRLRWLTRRWGVSSGMPTTPPWTFSQRTRRTLKRWDTMSTELVKANCISLVNGENEKFI